MTLLKEMLESLDMEEWLSHESIEYTRTRGSRGDQLNVKTCPSCGKSDWKVYLNAETGLGNCFHADCPKGTFNKFSFIRETLLNFTDKPNIMEHVSAFVREMGWRPRRKASVHVEMSAKALELPEYLPIPIDDKNLKYLINRRVSVEMAKYFNLGYIPSGYFGKRIFIPIHDLDGSLVSFQARDITGKSERKYLFPKGFASTGRILYNGQNAWRKKRMTIVEGAFDVISTKIAFDETEEFRDVAIVGSFGLSLSGGMANNDDDQVRRLIELKKAGLEEITLMWDGEDRALKKAIAAATLLNGLGFIMRIARLPGGRDPGDLAPSVIRQCYRRAEVFNQSSALKLKLAFCK